MSSPKSVAIRWYGCSYMLVNVCHRCLSWRMDEADQGKQLTGNGGLILLLTYVFVHIHIMDFTPILPPTAITPAGLDLPPLMCYKLTAAGPEIDSPQVNQSSFFNGISPHLL